jgi:hypothetical protein
MKRVGVIENSYFFPRGGRDVSSSEELMRVSGGNTGNVAYVHAIRSIITDKKIPVDWSTPPEFLNTNLDVLVVCCANQLGAHVDLSSWAERLSKLKIPVLLIGLGAQSNSFELAPQLNQGTLDFLTQVKRLSDGAPAITTRGDYTTDLLNQIDIASVSAGCPSALISQDIFLGKTILAKSVENPLSKMALCAGNPWHESSSIEANLIKLMEANNGKYILQHPQVMFRYIFDEMGDVTDIAHNAMCHLIFDEKRDKRMAVEWMMNYAKFFLQAEDWMSYLNDFDLVLGTRYHGVALGLQTAVPGLVMYIDSRTRELCEKTGVPSIDYMLVKGAGREQLLQMCRWDSVKAERLDNARKESARTFVNFFKMKGIQVADHVHAIAENDA